MRRVLMLIALLALAGCKKEEPPQGAVKVTVSYSDAGFLPDCVRVVARNPALGGQLPEVIINKERLDTGTPITVAVLPPDDWGPTVEVEAQSFEKACTGEPVETQTASVTLVAGKAVDAALRMTAADGDGDGFASRATGGTDCLDTEATVNPDVQEERCNNLDDNCDNVLDDTVFQLGQPCMVGAFCTGARQCDEGGGVACGNLQGERTAYRDGDTDTFGDRNSTVSYCEATPPAGYVTNSNDCNDGNANVRPGVTETCNNVDDDCDGPVDEGFNVDASCDPGQQCPGAVTCDLANGGTYCRRTQDPTSWYQDADGDGFGVSASAVMSCQQPAGFVNQGGDCNDSNPLIRPGATELCDALDNNCSGQSDEGAARCPASGPTWFERTVGAADQLWHSASTWTEGGVWAVGDHNRRAVLIPSSTTFTVSDSTSTGCGSTASGGTAWYTVWADPENNGRAYFGSAGGRLAHQDTNSTTCTQVTTTGSGLTVYGLVGIRTSGTLGFYGVSTSTTPQEGAAFLWDGASTLTFNPGANDLAYVTDVHGRTRDMVFAVGGYDETTPALTRPNIYRLDPSTTSTWTTETLPSTPGLNQLKGVWVVNQNVAYAVGNAGTVLKWNGTAWSTLPSPGATDFLSSVIAFDAYSVYVTSNNGTHGRVLRYNGQSWEVLHQIPGVRFNDITGTSPEDLWVVGNGGRILHWPQ